MSRHVPREGLPEEQKKIIDAALEYKQRLAADPRLKEEDRKRFQKERPKISQEQFNKAMRQALFDQRIVVGATYQANQLGYWANLMDDALVPKYLKGCATMAWEKIKTTTTDAEGREFAEESYLLKSISEVLNKELNQRMDSLLKRLESNFSERAFTYTEAWQAAKGLLKNNKNRFKTTFGALVKDGKIIKSPDSKGPKKGKQEFFILARQDQAK